MQTTNAAAPAATKGHPRGLYLLFTVEMWERFSYYGMRALLVLYLVAATDKGGFGWSKADALSLYGWYTGLVYLTPVLGGWIADNLLGQRKSVVIGGSLMVIGHFLMAFPGLVAFYAALVFLIAGNGMFKPNISTMVGGLYQPGDPRRDGAFTIFYMGINVGAFFSPLVCGWLGEKVSWHYGFAAAGVGMTLGLIFFLVLGNKLLGDIGIQPSANKAAKAAAGNAAPAAGLTREEWHRIIVILVLAVFVIIFWASFEQAGGLMNLYTEEKVDRSIFGWVMPASWLQAANPFFIVVLGPIFSVLWTRLGRSGKEPSTPVKMAIAFIFTAAGFLLMVAAARQSASVGKAMLMWVVASYFFQTVAELCLSPVGLSMVTKLAPPKLVSLLMGAWFLANAAANKLSGMIGGMAESHSETTVFFGITVATFVTGILLFAISPLLKKAMHGAEDRAAPAPAESQTQEQIVGTAPTA